MITAQDIYDKIHLKQRRLRLIKNLTPISHILDEFSKDFVVHVSDVYIDEHAYAQRNFVWYSNDKLYTIRTSYGNYGELTVNRVSGDSINTITVHNSILSYYTTSNFARFAKHDEVTGRVHCADGPAIMRYDLRKNGDRQLASVTYCFNGKTISEKAWNKKFGTNFDYKNQIELQKRFKIFGKEYKIAHVNNTKDDIRLILC